jgi:hypothetical protein
MATTRVSAADVQITGILDMRNNEVVGLETDMTLYPVRDDQGTTKVYVDTVRDEIVAGLPVLVDNGDF